MGVCEAMTLVKLIEDTYLLRGSPVTLIRVTGNSACIIDPGSSSERGVEIKRLISKMGVEKIMSLITHHHSDHVYALITLTPSEVYVPYGEELLVISKSFRVFLDYGLDLTPVNSLASSIIAPDLKLNNVLTLRHSDEICGFIAIDLRGHSHAHTGYSLGDEILYVGDALFGSRVLERVKIPYHNDYAAFISSLNRIKELVTRTSYKYIVLGHGPLITSVNDLLRLIDLNMRYLETTRELVISLLKEPRTLDQLTALVLRKLNIEETPLSYLLTHTTLRAIINNLALTRKIEIYVEGGQLLFRSLG